MRTLKRLALLLVFCLAMLGWQTAMADVSITPVPADRINVVTEPGLAMTPQTQNGQLAITIDPEKTHWPTVLTYSGLGEGRTKLGATAKLPTDPNIKYYCAFTLGLGSNPTYAQIMQTIQEKEAEAESYSGTIYREIGGEFDDTLPFISMGYRNYSKTEKLLVLNEAVNSLAICYFDTNKQLLSVETLVCTVNYTSKTRQIPNVEPYTISGSDVTPNVDRLQGFSYTLDDGNLIYTIDDPTVIDLTKGQYLKTRVNVPKGTAKVVTYDWWGAVRSTSTNITDDYFTISTSFADAETLGALETMRVDNYSYAFMDENDKILGGGLLWITVVDVENGNRLALHFLNDERWSPIPEERFRCSIPNGGGLVNVTYEDALVHLSANQRQHVTEANARKLPSALKNYQVQAPADAKSYRIGYTGGPNTFGARYAQSYQGFLTYSLSPTQSVLLPVQGGQWVNALPFDLNQNVFSLFASSKNGIDLYSVSAETSAGRAIFFVIEWFADAAGTQSLGVEWYGENAEELTLKTQTYRVPSHDLIKAPLDGPAVVCQQNGVTLYAEYPPQSGQNAYVIDLKLLDENGEVITDFSRLSQDGALEFFIPYPEGQSFSSNYTYSVTHYFDTDMNRSEPALEMQAEVGGIRFKVRSLSPIELSWESNDAPSAPPKTGDSSPIALWLALCALSLTAAAALLRNRRKA